MAADGPDLVTHLLAPFAPLPDFLSEYHSLIYAPAAHAADGSGAEVIATHRVTRLNAPLRRAAVALAGY